MGVSMFWLFRSRFQNDRRDLPVLWHQALLTFVQRYKADISTEQRDALLELLRKQSHHTITADVGLTDESVVSIAHTKQNYLSLFSHLLEKDGKREYCSDGQILTNNE